MQNSIETRGNSCTELRQPVVTLVQRNQQLKARATVPTFLNDDRRPEMVFCTLGQCLCAMFRADRLYKSIET